MTYQKYTSIIKQNKFNSVVTTPNFLSIQHLPQDVKDELIGKYTLPNFVDKWRVNKMNLVLTQLKLDGDTKNLKQAYDYMDKLSKNRKFDWRTLWPEFLK